MGKPLKSDIRSWMRRLREDMIGLNAALTTENVHQIKLYISDGLACLEEVAGLSEERYDITIECAENPSQNPIDAGAEEELDEGEEEQAEEELDEEEGEYEDEEGEYEDEEEEEAR